MFDLLAKIDEKRWSWALLALSALSLDLTALYFQYVLKLDPCVLCVYERMAVCGVMFAGVLGCINPKSLYLRLSGYALWAYSSYKGLALAIEHVGVQFPDNPFASSCDAFPQFWLPIDKWLPQIFAPMGMCDEINWMFLGWTMPQWLIVCFVIYSIILAAVLLIRLIINKKL